MEIKRPEKIKEKAFVCGVSDEGDPSWVGFKADYPDKAAFEKEFLDELQSELDSDETLDEYSIYSGIYTEVECIDQLKDMRGNYFWDESEIEEGRTYWTECPADYICEAYEYPVWIVNFRTKAKEDENDENRD